MHYVIWLINGRVHDMRMVESQIGLTFKDKLAAGIAKMNPIFFASPVSVKLAETLDHSGFTDLGELNSLQLVWTRAE